MPRFLSTHFAECADTDSEWEGWWVTMIDPDSHGPIYDLCTVAGGRRMRAYANEICERWNAFEPDGEVAQLRAEVERLRVALGWALPYIPESSIAYSEGDHGERVYILDAARAALGKGAA